jgi:hypothetical protein
VTSDPIEPQLRTPFPQRVLRAMLLDADLYEEVEADRGAGLQAAVVVVLASVAGGIGSFENGGLAGVFVSTIAALAGWVLWAFITYWIGTRLLPEPQTVADHGELLRTIGFSSAPGMLTFLGVIPGLNPWLYLIAGSWMLVAMVVAVRQALDYSGTLRAIAVCLIGFPVAALLLAISFLFMGPWPI